MSRFGQQWRGFAAWADTVEPSPAERGAVSIIERRAIPRLDDLREHGRPYIGLVCPRCHGEVVRVHPASWDFACLQCGFEPISKRPVEYTFEPYEDNAATARAAFRPEADLRNGAVTVRIAAEPLPTDQCVKCGVTVEGKAMKVHRCPDCYRDYCAALRFRIA